MSPKVRSGTSASYVPVRSEGCRIGSSLHGAVIGPEQLRRRPAPGAPAFREFRQRFGGRALVQAEAELDGFLKRKVACGKSVRVTDAEQQIDVRRPRADPLHGNEM